MTRLVVARLLQDPLGEPAPGDERGDIVQVSLGNANVYLEPDEYDDLDEWTLRVMLSKVIPWTKPTPPRPGFGAVTA